MITRLGKRSATVAANSSDVHVSHRRSPCLYRPHGTAWTPCGTLDRARCARTHRDLRRPGPVRDAVPCPPRQHLGRGRRDGHAAPHVEGVGRPARGLDRGRGEQGDAAPAGDAAYVAVGITGHEGTLLSWDGGANDHYEFLRTYMSAPSARATRSTSSTASSTASCPARARCTAPDRAAGGGGRRSGTLIVVSGVANKRQIRMAEETARFVSTQWSWRCCRSPAGAGRPRSGRCGRRSRRTSSTTR